MRTTIIAAATVLIASIFACGGGDTPPPATPPSHEQAADASAPGANPAPSGDAGTGPTASDKPSVPSTEGPKFDDLPKDKKVEIMATKVVPNVGKDFKDFNGTRYAKFGCVTCHGPSKKEDPHSVLPKLTMSNGGHDKLMKSKPEIMKFMAEKVTPDMAAALGEKPYNPETKQGFGCAGCHTIN